MTDNVQFSGTGWSPPENTPVATDYAATGGGGSAHFQRIKLDVGADGTTIAVTQASPLPIGTLPGGTLQVHGTAQALGTLQPLAGSVHLASGLPGTVQALGTVQTHGTSQALGTVQPLAGSVHPAAALPGTSQVSGTVREAPRTAAPARARVPAGTETATFIGANAARAGVAVYNGGNATLYLALGSSAGTTDYTTQLSPGAYYETPWGYTGTLSGIWSVQAGVTGTAYVTEVL